MLKHSQYNQNFSTLSDPSSFSSYVQDGKINTEGLILFKKTIYDYFKLNGRDFSWRNTIIPYYIVISEIMLQQTQTHRVKDKFEQFIAAFPNIESLADASLSEVIAVWHGLGYNRRAQSLHLLAKRVVKEFDGIIPDKPSALETFKGIGAATASSICAFAFNSPTVFIETNIRTVFIHAFFQERHNVQDKEILPLIAQTLDIKNPRKWYYALMDYGVMLKKLYPNSNKKSAHYTLQSKFEGSDRQIRGQILKILLISSSLSFREITQHINKDPQRIKRILDDLIDEQLINNVNHYYELPS